jgi:hypothetical protein
MSGRIFGLCTGVLAAVVVSGCASTSVSASRKAATGMAPGESVAVVAHRAAPCEGTAGKDCPASETAAENDFAECLAAAIQAEKADLTVRQAPELKRASFQDGRGFPETVETLMPLLQEDAFRRRLGVRYVVVVRGSTTTGASQFQIAPPGSYGRGWDMLMWGVGSEWSRSSSVTAEVVDVAGVRHAGAVTAYSHGKSGVAIPIVAIVPVPIPYSAPTESFACAALGKAVVDFLLHKGE